MYRFLRCSRRSKCSAKCRCGCTYLRLARSAYGGMKYSYVTLFLLSSLLLAWLGSGGCRKLSQGQAITLTALPGTSTESKSTVPSTFTADGNQLQLCECQRAGGFPNGLGCEKEGWFISGFEHEGTWNIGGGSVPLSHAICCRPCLPKELPSSPPGALPDGTHPVGVVTLGCHASPGKSWQAMQCDASTASFLTGFTDARQVPNYYDIYFPEGAAQCCSPGLLLSSGDVWDLVRCNCQEATSPSCGGTASNLLLTGFASGRQSSSMQWVPVAPLQCCGLCLGPHARNMQDCRELGFCSNQGVCALGVCECSEGFSGPDCSVREGGGGGGDGDGYHWFPPWATWMMIVGGVCSSMLSTVALRARQAARGEDSDEEEGGELQQPLLLYRDDVGSVGSVDTVSSDELGGLEGEGEAALEGEDGAEGEGAGEEAGLRPELELGASGATDAIGGPVGGGEEGGGVEGEGEGERAEGVRQGDHVGAGPPQLRAARHESAGEGPTPSLPTHPSTPRPVDIPPNPCTPFPALPSPTHASSSHPPDTPPSTPPARKFTPPPSLDGLLLPGGSDAVCSICLERPIQVALVPCGHANLCRKCSRRLDCCPFCRGDIQRRQRLFYSL